MAVRGGCSFRMTVGGGDYLHFLPRLNRLLNNAELFTQFW